MRWLQSATTEQPRHRRVAAVAVTLALTAAGARSSARRGGADRLSVDSRRSRRYSPRRGMRERLSYANVVATLALFIALGGSGYAAVELRDGQVKTRHLAKNAVTGAK